MGIKVLFKLASALLLLTGFVSVSHAVVLNENCVINVLNRTVQVQPNGTWALPNVPSSMGQVRARATCIQNGVTYVGETDYFNLVANTSIKVGAVNFGAVESVPKKLSYSMSSYSFIALGATQLVSVQATYPDNSVTDVTAAISGINYASSNPAIVTVSANGLLTAVANGTAIITARKDGAVAVATVRVAVVGGDSDGDGIPDAFEIAHGLNPNDPVDAVEDQDGDGLTALQEYNLGTDIFVADTDGDGISDGVEVAGSNGFVTNPLLFDSDGDGISDGLEIQTASDPNNAASYNLANALSSIDVTPTTAVIVYNTIDAEATKQLTVTGNLIDGTTIDLTARSKGTNYVPANLNVVSLGVTDGLMFAGVDGTTEVMVTNNGFQSAVSITVTTFIPAPKGSVVIPGHANNVDVYGNYAFVAAGASGLQVVGVANPNAPVIVGSLDTYGNAIDVRVSGSLAYIADGVSGLVIVDISNPATPTLVASVDTYGIAQDLSVQNGYVYIADGVEGLIVVDARVPSQPSIVATLTGLGSAVGVSVSGNLLALATNTATHVIDVTNPATPVLTGSVAMTSVKDVVLRNVYAYTASYTSGYQVIDISNPVAPVVVGNGPGTDFKPHDVALLGDKAFYAEVFFFNGVPYADISLASNPIYQGFVDFRSTGFDYNGTGISVGDKFIYLTAGRDIGNFAATGTTRLFIGQIRAVLDEGTIAPNVSLTFPNSTATFMQGQTITLQATAFDDVAVAAVNFYVNGVLVGTSTSGPPYTLTYTIPLDATGLTFSVSAVDYASNIGSGVDIPVVSFQPYPGPSITVASGPAVGTPIMAGQSVTFSANASDPVGAVTRVDLLEGGAVVASDTAAPYHLNYSVPFTAAGSLAFDMVVTASTGWTASTAVQNYNVIPYPGPTANLIAPVAGTALVEGDTVTFSATASDPIGTITRVDLLIDGAAAGRATTAPYDIPGTLPIDVTALNAEMVATASTGVSNSSGVRNYPVTIDPLTTVSGIVIDEYGTVAVGALVKVRLPDVPVESGTAVVNGGALLPAGPSTTIASSSVTGSVTFDGAVQPLLGDAVNLANNEAVSLTGAVALDMQGYNPLAPTVRTGAIDLYATAPSGLSMTLHGALNNFLPTAGQHTVDILLDVTAFTAGTNSTALPLLGKAMTVRVSGTVDVVTDPATSDVISMTWNVSLAQTVILDYSTTTAIDGSFTIPGVPTIFGDIIVDATIAAPVGGLAEQGSSAATPYVRGGLTDAGTIRTYSARFELNFGTRLGLSDDSWSYQTFGFNFPYYGGSYVGVYAGSNGYLTFNSGDSRYWWNNISMVVNGSPRISPYFTDLNPNYGDDVYVNKLADRMVITWSRLPYYWIGNSSNTIQAILFADGRIQIGYNGLSPQPDRLVGIGISPGGTPPIKQVNYLIDTPLSGLSGEAVVQGYNVSSTVGLDGSFIIFRPNAAGGYDVQYIAP